MVEAFAWAFGSCLASAEHRKRAVRRVLAAQGEARMREAPVAVARPAGEHSVAWGTPEVQLFGEFVLPETLLGVERRTEGVLALQLAGPRGSVEVVEDQYGSERQLGPELVVVWADRWYH